MKVNNILKYSISTISVLAKICLIVPIGFNLQIDIKAQTQPPIASIQSEFGNELIKGINNPITIVAQQITPVSLNQIEINGGKITGGNGNFTVFPDSTDFLEIKVKTNLGEVKKRFHVKPITAKPRLNVGYYDGGNIKNGAMRAATGLIGSIECCGFDAKCTIKSF